jgi:hypothetical protein
MENKKGKCESCCMPLAMDTGSSGSDKYCSHCAKDGQLLYVGSDLKEFQKHAYEGMVAQGMGKCKAKFFTWLIRFAPRWKQK